MTDFSVLVIATNKYVHYAKELIESIDEHLFTDASGEVVIFTDQPEFFRDDLAQRINLKRIKIPSYGWPDATLRRYEIFDTNWGEIAGDVVMYIDADTRIVQTVSLESMNFSQQPAALRGVTHPGYFQRGFLKTLISKTRLGPWETSTTSTAFVPLLRRRTYIAGGVWMGTAATVHQLVVELRKQVDTDREAGVIAKWHDESHINKWASRYHLMYLPPSWAYAPGYENLRSFEPIVELVHKPDEFFTMRDEPQATPE